MKKYHSLIKNWFIISIATCIFSYLLWALMDFDTFVGTGVTFKDLCTTLEKVEWICTVSLRLVE